MKIEPHCRWKSLLYCLLLLLEVVVFHRQVIFYDGFLFPWDFRTVHLPLAAFVADSLRSGEFPWWDPYTYCGTPIYANIQTALFYPPVFAATLVSTWLSADSLPRLLAIAVVFQVFFAGVCTYFLLRRLGAQPAAAWIGGTMYELGCFFTSQSQHMGAMHGATWLPLAWLCVIALRSKFQWTWMAALSVSLAMTVLAGLPQVSVVAFGSVLFLAITLSVFGLARRRLPLQILILWLWALALSALQIVPTVELTNNSVAKYRAEWLGSGGGIKTEALISLVVPNYWNVFDLSKFHGPSDPTFLYLYSSLPGLALAIGAICWKPKRMTWVFSLTAAAAAIWMLGDSTAAGRTIFQSLPIRVRIGIHPEFTLCVFALAVSVLAGLGANHLLRTSRAQIIAGMAIVLDLTMVGSGRPFNVASLQSEPGFRHDSVDGSRELVSRLRELTNIAVPPYRFDTAEAPFHWSSTGALLGIPTANGCDPLALERIMQVRRSFSPGPRWGTCLQVVDFSSPVLNLTNARYIISRKSIPEDTLRFLNEIAGHKIYENPQTLPRFFMLNRAMGAGSLTEAAEILHSSNFDPANVVIMEPPLNGFTPSTGRPTGRVDVLRYRPSHVALQTNTPAPAILVATDVYYPGWEASIDGKPTPLYIADVAFRGIVVPSGQHHVEMRFVPRIFFPSLFVSILAGALVLFVVFRSIWRRVVAPKPWVVDNV